MSRMIAATNWTAARKFRASFVIAGGDRPVVLDLVGEALDEIALGIEREVTITLHLAVDFWRDHRSDCPLIECID